MCKCFLTSLAFCDPQRWNWPDLRSLCNHRSPACWSELRWLYADTCWSKTHKTTGDENIKHTQRFENTTSWSSSGRRRRTAASHLGDRVEGEVINTRNSAGEATCVCVKVVLSFVHSSLVGYDLFSHTHKQKYHIEGFQNEPAERQRLWWTTDWTWSMRG